MSEAATSITYLQESKFVMEKSPQQNAKTLSKLYIYIHFKQTPLTALLIVKLWFFFYIFLHF